MILNRFHLRWFHILCLLFTCLPSNVLLCIKIGRILDFGYRLPCIKSAKWILHFAIRNWWKICSYLVVSEWFCFILSSEHNWFYFHSDLLLWILIDPEFHIFNWNHLFGKKVVFKNDVIVCLYFHLMFESIFQLISLRIHWQQLPNIGFIPPEPGTHSNWNWFEFMKGFLDTEHRICDNEIYVENLNCLRDQLVSFQPFNIFSSHSYKLNKKRIKTQKWRIEVKSGRKIHFNNNNREEKKDKFK